MDVEVSVVVPTRDRSAWLRLTLRSVLWQRDVDLEVIVVDDASTDDTSDVIASMADRRVRVVRHVARRGVSASRNRGAAEARGEWLAFIDDDDVWAPDKVALQIRAAIASRRMWGYTGCVNVDDRLRIVGGRPPLPPERVRELILRSNVIPGGGSNVVVRRSTFERVGPFDVRLKNTEDWEMSIRLAKEGPPAWVPEPLLGYRVHAWNASLDIKAIFQGASSIERWHRTKVDRGMLHRWVAESYLRTGQRGRALRHLAIAAARGQSSDVGRDVRRILERRVARMRRRPATGLEHVEWTGRAEGWLHALRDE